MVGTKMLLRTTLVCALVGGFMLFSITPKILADDRDSCYRNVQNWEQKLDRDMQWAFQEGSMHFEKESSWYTLSLC